MQEKETRLEQFTQNKKTVLFNKYKFFLENNYSLFDLVYQKSMEESCLTNHSFDFLLKENVHFIENVLKLQKRDSYA